MNKLFKKILIVLLLMSVTFTIVSCDDLVTMFDTTATSTELQTTVEETTVEITTVPNTTIETTVNTTVETTVVTTTQTTVTTTYTDGSTLEVTSPTKLVYEVYDELNLDGMIVTFNDTVLQDTDYTVSDVDMTTYGDKQVLIDYDTYQTSFIIEVNLPTYLLSATDLTGSDLLLQLRTIVNTGFSGVDYGEARYVLDETDADPLIPGNLILVYTRNSVSGYWDSGITWNREHVWPQSLLGEDANNSTVNSASDLHNLMPANPSANSSRGNKYFDNATTTVAYEPPDEVKGDIARALFYMDVMYSHLSLVDSTPNVYEMGKLSTLIEWNSLDPVDDFERNRNQEIYSNQFNYNPFVLYPDFVELIWE